MGTALADYVGEFQLEGPVTAWWWSAQGPGAPLQNGRPVERVATEPPQPPELWNHIESGDYAVRDAG